MEMKLDSVEINTRAMAWNGLWPLGGRVVGCMRLRSRAEQHANPDADVSPC